MKDKSREEKLEELLSEGLDLCVRARTMDQMDRRKSALGATEHAKEWQESGNFDRYVERHNIQHPGQQISTRSGTIPLWAQDQYEKDVADWEHRTRSFLLGHRHV